MGAANLEDTNPDMLASAVVSLLVAEHPTQLSFAELVWLFSASPDDWAERDALEVVLAKLAGDGLVHHSQGFFFATRAAMQTEHLRD